MGAKTSWFLGLLPGKGKPKLVLKQLSTWAEVMTPLCIQLPSSYGGGDKGEDNATQLTGSFSPSRIAGINSAIKPFYVSFPNTIGDSYQ